MTLLSRGSERCSTPKQRVLPALLRNVLMSECVLAFAGFAWLEGFGSALAVSRGGHLLLRRDKCGLFLTVSVNIGPLLLLTGHWSWIIQGTRQANFVLCRS